MMARRVAEVSQGERTYELETIPEYQVLAPEVPQEYEVVQARYDAISD